MVDRDNSSIHEGFTFTGARFFHDRSVQITPGAFQPRITGTLNGKREVFQFYFKINRSTPSQEIRIRILNGNIVDFTRGITRKWNDEISINVPLLREKALCICFDTNPIYGQWIAQFGNENGWNYCPVNFDFYAFLRTSIPVDNNTMILPRFLVSPVLNNVVLGNALRGSVGQPFGRTIRHMKELAVSFARIRQAELIDYFERVSNTTPHFIVPYPESVSEIPPFWCTLIEAPPLTKRAENGWFFNSTMKWREAY